MIDRALILTETSPDGRWRLIFRAPSEIAPHFYAEFRDDVAPEYYGFAFGMPVPVDQVTVKWDLPSSVCGIFLGSGCYALFDYSDPPPKRRRDRARSHEDQYFNDDAISWVCGTKYWSSASGSSGNYPGGE